MSANPALVRTSLSPDLLPALFPSEVQVLKRGGVEFYIDNVHTSKGWWKADGNLFLSNIRLVFVADIPHESGLQSFDIPLVYTRNDTLNQPIFGCNNVEGEVWSTALHGGPNGTLPPHKFKVSFMEGGIGTFYPLYYTLSQRAKAAMGMRDRPTVEANPASLVNQIVNRAFVDPNDPSTIYLTQPTGESTRLRDAPKYANNYGKDERYEDMGLRP